MLDTKAGDWLYCFMGENLIYFTVTMYAPDINPKVVLGEDAANQYTFYISDCYSTKEDAIAGMLRHIREITDCDCGEDEQEVGNLFSKLPGNYFPNCS